MKRLINESTRKHCYGVDYCRFGGHGLQKPTMIVCTVDIGFMDMKCLGQGKCLSMDINGNHLNFYGNKDLKSRQHIPTQLCIQLGNALFMYLNKNPLSPQVVAWWKPLKHKTKKPSLPFANTHILPVVGARKRNVGGQEQLSGGLSRNIKAARKAASP